MGQSLAEAGPLVTVGRPTRQNAEIFLEIIVNLWMRWISILDKKDTSKKVNKQQIKEY